MKYLIIEDEGKVKNKIFSIFIIVEDQTQIYDHFLEYFEIPFLDLTSAKHLL